MIKTFQLENGLTLIVEEMTHVESVSYDLIVPGGFVADPHDQIGASLVLAELIGRGAGKYDSRELSEAFDGLGIRHGEGAGADRFTLGGSLVADALPTALELVSLIVREPRLPDDEVPNIRSLLLQDIDSLPDNPARRAI